MINSELKETYADPGVLSFYKTLPFNFPESTAKFCEAIVKNDPLRAYPVLSRILRPGMKVLDLGCGAGWFANSLAYHYRTQVTGLDFNEVAVDRAKQVGDELQLPVNFEVADLFTYTPDSTYDLVVSLGVLHHTRNCHAALRRVAQKMLNQGGYFFVGLYHADGRAPFLEHFEKMKNEGCSENELRKEFRKLRSSFGDDQFLESWFRDQVIHPLESQHRFAEVSDVFTAEGMSVVSTSLNRHGTLPSFEEAVVLESKLRSTAQKQLELSQYFPGFFDILATLPKEGKTFSPKDNNIPTAEAKMTEWLEAVPSVERGICVSNWKTPDTKAFSFKSPR